MFLVFIIIFIIVLNLATAIDVIKRGAITGETITGKASTQQTNISIFVLPGVFPTLEIKKPDNKTYINNQSLLLDYDATNAVEVWYNLDNGDNTTITSRVYFNISQGSHTLWLYANSSAGNINSTNVTFAVDLTRFSINKSEWDEDEKIN